MYDHLKTSKISFLADEVVAISATSLLPGSEAKISLSFKGWRSEAVFLVDESGSINLVTDAPKEGSYGGVDAMGLFWSMTTSTEELKPMSSPTPDRMALALSSQGIEETIFIERLYAKPGVKRIEVRDNGLFGVLYLPAEEGPHAGIINLNGSDGGLSEATAALLASRGYAAFALAYFNYSTMQADLSQLPLEYFAKAIDWLQQHEAVDADRLAVRGGSRGGELALLLGSLFPALKVVVANVPSSVHWAAVSDSRERSVCGSWHYKDKPLAWISPVFKGSDFVENEPISFTPGFKRAMDNEALVHAAEIEVEKINGPILMVSGEDDAMWPSTYFSNMVVKRLETHNFTHAVQHIACKNAGHLVSGIPYQPTTITSIIHPVINMPVTFGGTPEADAKGEIEGWSSTMTLFESHLSKH